MMAGEKTDTNQQNTDVDVVQFLASLGIVPGSAGVSKGSVYLGPKTKTVIPPTGIAAPGAKPQKVLVDDVTTESEANALYLTDPRVQSDWRKAMKKYGLETGNPLIERKAWETAVAGASDWFATSKGQAKVTPEQYLQWWAAGSKKKTKPKPDLTRSIYDYSDEQIAADIDVVALKRLGRSITEEDKSQDWYKNLSAAINDMALKGTVSTVKDVRNPKTGKLERISTQIPKFTKEKATQTIESALIAADPEAVERKTRIDFANRYLQGGARG